ncbi:methyltransferase [Paractinoplanes rhizophilus]|uniref:phosphatidyl-N-methylethanolamine N-methyltransferase n=1 Tax=Paractinoplanes rhizophilus TaxID=1416877 RepID=A0ABW2HTJ4_9ACTN|nr:methyltransferase [Actinoplanes sp.]
MRPGIGSVEEAHAGHLETMLAYVDGQALDRRETFHVWEAELPAREREAFAALADSAAIRASILEAFPGCTVHNVDEMNEVYVSNMGAKGSDHAFLQHHIDGPFAFLPFLTLLRCLVVVRGNERVATIFLAQRRGETLRTGQFCWFDYNRDIHYITKSGDPAELLDDSRICLKAHYAVVPRWLAPVGKVFAGWNETYNRRARQLFLASKNPQSAIGKFLGAVVNAGTFAYPLFLRYIGVLNLLVVLLFWGVSQGDPTARTYLFSFVHYFLYFFAYTFRAVEPGKFARDATLFQLIALGTLAFQYGRMGLDVPSLVVAALGFGLSGLAFLRLGPDRTYFGAELGVVPPGRVTGFPYGVIPHPMIVGKLIGFAGLALSAPFRAAWWPLLLGHVAFYLLVLAQETSRRHLGDTYRFEETYRDFARFHQRTGNVVVHLVTTGLGLLGILGLIGAFVPAPAAAVAFAAAVYAFFCAYTTPDQTALMSILFTGVVLAVYLALPVLGWPVSVGLLVLGTAAQELSHIVFRERTYMSSYQRERGAWKQFLLHSVLLVPLLCRAAFFRTALRDPSGQPAA